MKVSASLLLSMIAMTATSYPINASEIRDGLRKQRIEPRGRILPISTTPAFHRAAGITRKPSAARPVLRKADGNEKNNGNGSGQPGGPVNGQLNGSSGLGNGNGNGKANDLSMEKLTKFPPAQAAAHTYEPGFIRTSNDDNLDPSTRTTWPSNGIRDRKVIKGPVAAFAGATALGNGGSATAIGHARVAATVLNHPGTRACVNCTLPGQNPIQVTIGPVGNPVQLQAVNAKPHLGGIKISAEKPGCIECTFPDQNTIRIKGGNRLEPVTIQASNKFPHSGPLSIHAKQDGPGTVTAAASNRPE